MQDLLLPRTDLGVALQAGVAFVLLLGLNLWARGRGREVRIFVVGLTLLTVAGFGLRALH